MNMELILTQDVNHLGKAGELVSVKRGYGRNYLIPQGLAVSATRRNKAQLEHEQARIARKVAKERGEAADIAERINGMTLQFERLVGEEDKLFGSVTSRDIAEQLEVAGVDIDHRRIQLAEPVRTLGKFDVDIRLRAEVVANLKFWVVGKESE
jgi:large subunit ribosomal protein L9